MNPNTETCLRRWRGVTVGTLLGEYTGHSIGRSVLPVAAPTLWDAPLAASWGGPVVVRRPIHPTKPASVQSHHEP